MGVAALWFTAHPGLTPHTLQLVGLVVASLTLGVAAGRLGDRVTAWLTLPLAAFGGWILVDTHRLLAVPQVDQIAPLGIGASRWFFCGGLLLLLTSHSALAPRMRRRRGATRTGMTAAWLAGSALYATYWVAPQTFFDEGVDTSVAGEMPIVVDGAIEHHPWERALQYGRPIQRIPQILQNERVRAGLAHGVALEGGEGTPLLAVAWKAQGLLVATLVCAEAWVSVVVLLVGGLLLGGIDPGPLAWRFVTALLRGVAVGPPLANVVLAVASPDRDLWNILAASVAQLLVVCGADLGGRVLCKGAA